MCQRQCILFPFPISKTQGFKKKKKKKDISCKYSGILQCLLKMMGVLLCQTPSVLNFSEVFSSFCQKKIEKSHQKEVLVLVFFIRILRSEHFHLPNISDVTTLGAPMYFLRTGA